MYKLNTAKNPDDGVEGVAMVNRTSPLSRLGWDVVDKSNKTITTPIAAINKLAFKSNSNAKFTFEIKNFEDKSFVKCVASIVSNNNQWKEKEVTIKTDDISYGLNKAAFRLLMEEAKENKDAKVMMNELRNDRFFIINSRVPFTDKENEIYEFKEITSKTTKQIFLSKRVSDTDDGNKIKMLNKLYIYKIAKYIASAFNACIDVGSIFIGVNNKLVVSGFNVTEDDKVEINDQLLKILFGGRVLDPIPPTSSIDLKWWDVYEQKGVSKVPETYVLQVECKSKFVENVTAVDYGFVKKYFVREGSESVELKPKDLLRIFESINVRKSFSEEKK